VTSKLKNFFSAILWPFLPLRRRLARWLARWPGAVGRTGCAGSRCSRNAS
jgi:hypothetical protein